MKTSDPYKILPKAKKYLGVKFKRARFIASAVIHPSYRNENVCEKMGDFDRLEFFGDSILNFVVCQKLFRTFPKYDEGVLSRLRSIIVSRKILYRVACETGLPKFLQIGRRKL